MNFGKLQTHSQRKRNIVKLLLGGALAASIFSLAVPASAQGLPQNPIAVESVSSAPNDTVAYLPGVVGIGFQNNGPSAAREITFMVTDNSGRSTTIQDVGTFANGVAIHNTLQVGQLADDVKVRVIHAEFTDGLSWSANVPVAQPAPLDARPGTDAEHGLTL